MSAPEIRFPAFNGEWKKVPLKSLMVRERREIDLDPVETYTEIGVRSHCRGVFHKEPTTAAQIGEKRVFPVVPDTLVFNIVFAWEQAVAVLTDKEAGMIASHRFPMFRANSETANLRFLERVFQRKRGKHILELSSPGGAGRNKTLNIGDLLSFKIAAPSREEQEKIAAFLGAVDARLDGLRREKAHLTDTKTGLMQRIFSQEIRFRADDGSAFPEWDVVRLGDVAIAFSGGTPTAADPTFFRGHIPFIKSAEIGRAETEQYLTEQGLKGSAARMVKKNDLLYALYGANAGDVAISKIDGAINQAVLCIRPKTSKQFLLHFFGFRRGAIRSKYLQGGQGNLSGEIVKSLSVPFPHTDEQRKIADALGAMDAKISAVGAQIEKLETFKQGLLQKMFV